MSVDADRFIAPPLESSETMSTVSRRQKIEAMLVEDPADTFLRYSLCWNSTKRGITSVVWPGLRGLMQDATPYVPAFFMGAAIGPTGQVSELARN